jgi:NitT/TauT family transport system substrate-binding protein
MRGHDLKSSPINFDAVSPARRRSLRALVYGMSTWALGLGITTPLLAAASSRQVRLSLPGAGTAGAVWRPLADTGHVERPTDVSIAWVGGDPGQVQTQLLAGAVDIAAYGPLGAAAANQRGGDIVLFAPALNNHGSWLVRGDSPYKSIQDLKGKRIATQPQTSDTYRQAFMAAKLHGLDLQQDFKVNFGPAIANLALFARGDVDAVITIEPTSTRLIAKGAREIARVGDLWRSATGDGVPLLLIGQGAHRSWIDANKTLAGEMFAYYRALNQVLSDTPDLLKTLHLQFGIPASETAAIELLPKRLANIYPTRWDQQVFADIDRQISEGVRLGIIPKPPVRSLYTQL